MGTTTGWISFGKKTSGFGDQSRPKSAIEQTISVNNNFTPTLSIPKIVKTPPNIKPENVIRSPLPLLCEDDTSVVTTTISEAATITIPIRGNTSQRNENTIQTYKTMPLNSRPSKHILDDGTWKSPKPVRGSETLVKDSSYQQRRTKCHKNYRTASCSSSDASDDDSESRKKRPPKHINTPTHKPLPQRRDSHDDSSDSQEHGATGSGGNGSSNHVAYSTTNSSGSGSKQSGESGNNGGSSLTRRHRGGRRACETRLRESQSLNRITEVQEADAAQPPPQRSKGFFHPTRFLHGFGKRPISISSNSQTTNSIAPDQTSDKSTVQSVIHPTFRSQVHAVSEEKENCHKIVTVTEKHGFKKVRLFSRYFQVHKKLCLPRLPTFPGLWGRTGRLYKAQSCGSIVRDKITSAGASSLLLVNELCKDKPIVLDSHRARIKLLAEMAPCNGHNTENYISLNSSQQHYSICQVHLGDASKCCGLC